MVEFERIYGDRANLFGAILGRISRPNKVPIGRAVGTLRPRGRFIAAGGKRAGGWRRLLIDPITPASLSPFVADPSLRARPWSDLERFVGPLEVEERLWGSGYLARGVKGDYSPT